MLSLVLGILVFVVILRLCGFCFWIVVIYAVCLRFVFLVVRVPVVWVLGISVFACFVCFGFWFLFRFV